MKFETYPDREFLMLGLANVIAGQLADFLQGRQICLPELDVWVARLLPDLFD